jgi:hypothetical protein
LRHPEYKEQFTSPLGNYPAKDIRHPSWWFLGFGFPPPCDGLKILLYRDISDEDILTDYKSVGMRCIDYVSNVMTFTNNTSGKHLRGIARPFSTKITSLNTKIL